ncbi:MAG: hypothetical protein J7539_16170 [Niabella sp.]|nr:hypothetical protein [Niabella sp.]
MYDSRVGRWMSIDPEGQYFSPYVGMGNDPVNGVDPDGGFKTGIGAWLYRLGHSDWRGASIEKSGKYGDYYLQKGIENGVAATFGGQRYNNTGYMPSGFDYGHWANFQKTTISAAYTPPPGTLDTRGVRINIGGDVVNDIYVGGRTLLSGPLGVSKRGFNDLYGNTVTYDQQTSAGINLFVMAATAGEGSALETSVENVVANGVHGNSLKSLRATWGYKLFLKDGTFLKNGITSKLIPEARYTKAFMSDKYMEAIPFSDRFGAYQWEFQQNQILRGPLNFNMH